MADDLTTTPTTTADATTATTAPTNGTAAPPATSPTWHDTYLPEDLRNVPELRKYASVAELAKGHVNQAKLVGQKPQGLIVPGQNATPEEKTAFDAALRKALNVPEAASGYQITRPDVALDGAWDEKIEQEYLGLAHKHAIPPAAVQDLLNLYGKWERTKLEMARQDTNRVGAELRQKWGANYDAYLGRANRAITEYGGDDLLEHYAANGMGRDPLTIAAWAAVAQDLSEAGFITGEGAPVVTAEEADSGIKATREELKNLPDGHPRKAELIDRIVSLTKAKNRGR